MEISEAPAADHLQRARELLGGMTLEEKIAQLVCLFGQEQDKLDGFPAGLAPGAITHYVRASNLPPREAAAAVAELQRRFREQSRLGIPVLICEEAVCGLEVDGATLFPDGLGLAASWDPDLLREIGRVVNRQMVALGVRNAWGPLCDVARDPRWGRVEETYGEDPYLVGTLAAAYAAAVQQDDVAVTLKHFVGYAASEGGRNLQAAHLGERELREVHVLPFEMAIAAGARGAMASYNTVDGVPVQGSRELLTGVLRDELGLRGVLISDLGSVDHLHSRHGVSSGPTESAAQALEAGLDVDLAGTCFQPGLPEALASGRVSMEQIDRAVVRVLGEKFRLGLFDEQAPAPPSELELPEDRRLAREAAARAIVLLRNDPAPRPLLPLDTGLGSLAVIGPNADRAGALLGNYSYPVMARAIELHFDALDPTAPGGRRRQSADIVGQLPGTVPVPTVLEAVRAAAPPGLDVRFAPGCPIADPDRTRIAEAAELASASDAALVVVGDQSGLFSAATVGEGVDSALCRLPGVQQELIEAIVATGTPTVVVLLGGRPLEMAWAESLPALLAAWFPGEEGGPALAEILFGVREPGGRLPVTLLPRLGLAPLLYSAVPSPSYFDAPGEPAFAFGHGLGYTTFEYRDLRLSDREIAADGTVDISCTVRNTGDRAGEDVVQLYLRDPIARTSRPRLELKGFQRLGLAAGEERSVTFHLHADRTSFYEPGSGWIVEPGEIQVMIGSSSARISLRDSFVISGPVRHVPNGRVLATDVSVDFRR